MIIKGEDVDNFRTRCRGPGAVFLTSDCCDGLRRQWISILRLRCGRLVLPPVSRSRRAAQRLLDSPDAGDLPVFAAGAWAGPVRGAFDLRSVAALA